ncbi:hypothetical protein BJ982_003827 [Sphaerisporangium siamense]|uniref:Uncharacterized protein n=1 Tax=Sphaerisporangium siamense TaxID=795645 RepID=A0A7W7D8J3_9ACTN|nr:hypothetical protein [Sphaerisporangium siamense]
MHDQMSHQEMTSLAVQHRADTQGVADALTVAAAGPGRG